MRLKFSRKYFSYPYIGIVVVFVALPIILLGLYAFTDSSGGFTLRHFLAFFTSRSSLVTLGSSVWLAFLTTIICLVLAYPLAMVLASSNAKSSRIIVLLFVLPMWINFLLRTFAIKNLFDLIGLPNGYTAVLIGMVYDFFPFMLLPLYTILANMDKSVLEAGRDLGANKAEVFFGVMLPLSVPGIVSGVLMVFMPCISTFAIADLLGNARIYLFGNKINDYFSLHDTWNIGSALSIMMLILIGLSMLIANKITKGAVMSSESGKGGSVL